MSKNFKPEEVIGYLTIDGKQVTYLKMGVKRNPKYESLDYDHTIQLNQALVWIKRWEEYYKKVVGIDDFEQPK